MIIVVISVDTIRSAHYDKMLFKSTFLVILVNGVIYEGASDPLSSTHTTRNETSNYTYASNTPFVNESAMESFILNEWQGYPQVNSSHLMKHLKEILYTVFNPDKSKIRVCHDQPLSTYKNPPPGSHRADQTTLIMPTVRVPLESFKNTLELMILSNDVDENVHDKMIAAVNNLDIFKGHGDSRVSKFIRNCEAVVVVPRLFKGNVCQIGPIIKTYLPALTNVSLIKLNGTYFRYDSVKNFAAHYLQKSCNIEWDDLKNMSIPKDDDEISFENLKIVIDHFQKNVTMLYLRINRNGDDSLAEEAVPLSHWQHVYNTLHTNVNGYLKLIKGENGSTEYEKLPWIGFSKNATNVKNQEIVSLQQNRSFLPQDEYQSEDSDVRHFGDIFHQDERVEGQEEQGEENSIIGEQLIKGSRDNFSSKNFETNHFGERSNQFENEKGGENSNFEEQFIKGFSSQINSQLDDSEPNYSMDLFHDTEIEGENLTIEEKNEFESDSESPIVGVGKFETDFDVSSALHKNGIKSNKKYWNFGTADTARSSIRHQTGSLKKSKLPNRPLHAQVIKSKSRSKIPHRFSDHMNGSNNGRKILKSANPNLVLSKKDMLGAEGPKSKLTSDVSVSSPKKNDIESTINYKDEDTTLVEKIQSDFDSFRV